MKRTRESQSADDIAERGRPPATTPRTHLRALMDAELVEATTDPEPTEDNG